MALKEKHPTQNRRYIVVAKSKVSGEMEPLHPGTIDKASAGRLGRCVPFPSEVWTQEQWGRYDDRIRMRETIRQMLADWNNLTDEQRAEASAKAAELADEDPVCVMDFGHCVKRTCDLWADCPHQERGE